MRNLGIGILIGLVVAGLILWLANGWHGKAPLPAPTPPTAVENAPKVAPAGDYAEDWQKTCAQLLGAAQSDCTAKLDAAYGRKAELPVPAEKSSAPGY